MPDTPGYNKKVPPQMQDMEVDIVMDDVLHSMFKRLHPWLDNLKDYSDMLSGEIRLPHSVSEGCRECERAYRARAAYLKLKIEGVK